MLEQLSIETIGEADLARLVDGRVSEGRMLEFKRDLPGNAFADGKEFLADVTAFANAQGGHLLFGIAEKAGTATGVPGVEVADTDAALARLENMLRDGVSPRLIGVRMVWVSLSDGKNVLVVRIQASLAAPHQVSANGRFFNRNAAGKFPMDAHDLRHAFNESGSLPVRFRQLHTEAIARAQGHEMPLRIKSEPTAVVSVMPLNLFREERDIPITRDHAIVPVATSGYSSIDMIEGVLVHSPIHEGSLSVRTFALTHRAGRADVAWTIGGRLDIEGRSLNLLFAPSFENGLLEAANAAQMRLRQFGVEGPWVVFASVYGVRNHVMSLGWGGDTTRAAYRDQALLGELSIEKIDEEALLPIARNFWLLLGEQRPEGRSLNQDG